MMRLLLAISLLLVTLNHAHAQTDTTELCGIGIQQRPPDFTPSGIILTSFDADSLWVYDIERATRYPLPETRPCTTNCQLSPDARWLTYMNPQTFVFSQMRLDGTQRTAILGNIADVQWWSNDHFLVWTADHRAYLMPTNLQGERQHLPATGLLNVQPNGYWGMTLIDRDGVWWRALVNLQATDALPVLLGADTPYFNHASWSPDGTWLAYVARGALDTTIGIEGSEIFLIRAGDAIPRQLTFLSRDYGAVRINGFLPNQLSWSPDGTKIAFWMTELLGADPQNNTGAAVIHVVDVNDGRMWRYCGFSTTDHTPTPSRLIWSPDSTHIAFAGNVPNDDKGHLLLALRLQDGNLTELSDGIYPALGTPDVIAWGLKP